MAQILLATWGSLGDLHPMLALGLGLREHGHNIIFATTENYRDTVESIGLSFRNLRPALPTDPDLLERIMDPKTGPETILKEVVLSNVQETYSDLFAIAKDVDFLVAHEIIYAAPLVAEMLQLRWASCTLAPNSFFSAYEPLVTSVYPALAKLHLLGPNANQLVVKAMKLVTRSWGEPLYRLRQELGLPPIENPIIGPDKHSPHLILALFSSTFGSPQPDWPSNTVTTGFTFYDGSPKQRLTPGLKAFLDAGDMPLVFTLGSAAVKTAGNFYATSAQAASELGCRAVLLLGENAPPTDLPKSIFTSAYEPYSALFPQARVIIHQGGVGTTAQALRSSRPSLVVPYTLDQPDNAARSERLGLAQTIKREQYSTVRVVEKLCRLLQDSSYAIRAAEIGKILQGEDGVRAACDAIEQELKAVMSKNSSH